MQVRQKRVLVLLILRRKQLVELKLGQVDQITTANIGKFHGGSATNIVADEVILEAEARSHDPEE